MGAAPTRYVLEVNLPDGNVKRVELPFQMGVVGTNGEGVNGIADEALVEVLIHRLAAFQGGPWRNDFNQSALEHLMGALADLEQRSLARNQAGVAGTTELAPDEQLSD